MQVTEVPDRHGTRLHVLSPGPVGRLEVSYDADVGDRVPSPQDGSWPAERIEYIRPSRYAESDRMAAISENAFGDREGKDLLNAVSSYDWHVIDPTALAPRGSLVRIATGLDAADTAFMTVQSGLVDLLTVQVSAVADGVLPLDDVTRLDRLG